MKEKTTQDKIRKWLTENQCLVFKYHGTAYGVKGHSDLYGVLPSGRAFFLEIKSPGKEPAPWQLNFLAIADSFGAVTGWCDSLEDAKRVMNKHLTHQKR